MAADRTVKVTLTADASRFTSEVKRAEAATRGLADGAKSGMADVEASSGRGASALSRMAESARENGAAWQTTGATLTAAGVAVGSLAVAAVKTAADFDASMSQVAAATHAPADELESLRNAAIQAGADTAFSATEAAGGIEELAKAGISTSDILNGGLKGALDLAAAGNLGVGESAEIAATAMTQFGLSGGDVGHVADLLAAGAGKAQGSVQDLGYALKQGGLVASQMGLSIEETTGTLAAFASAGLIGSDAGTSLRTMLLRLMNPSRSAADTMKELGIHVNDASGNFVGMTNFAGQLQEKMSGLSEEQRKQALATIFGSDAIRGASVLYQQGAEGLQSWIDQTNDAGYASETAALQMDNLKGDLEKLSGSWETALIKIGSSADGPLRSLVQGANSAVDAFGELSPTVQGAVLGVSAIGGVALTAAGGFFLLAPRILESLDAMRTLGITGENVKAKLASFWEGFTASSWKAKVGTAAVTAGLIALGVGMNEISKSASDNMASVDALTATLKSTSDAASIIGAAFREGGIETAGGFSTAAISAENFHSAVEQAGDPGPIAKLGDTIAGVFGDNVTETQQLKNEFRALGQSLAGLPLEESRSRFQSLWQAAGGTQGDAQNLLNAMPQYRDALQQVAAAAGLATDDATLLKIAMGEIDPAAQSAADGSQAAADGLGAVGDAAEGATQSIGDVIDKLSEFYQMTLSERDAARGLEEAFDNASDAVAENGATLDITTEAGRKNESALDGIATAAWKLADSMAKAGYSSEDIQASMQTARDNFIATAEAMGLSSDEAAALADQLGLIPEDIAIDVSADTTQAGADVDAAAADADSTTATMSVGADTSQADSDVKLLADTANSTTCDVTVNADAAMGYSELSKYVSFVDNSDGTVSIEGDPSGARWQKDSIQGEIDRTTGTVTISGQDHASGTLRGVKLQLDSLRDKSITVTVTQFFRKVGSAISGFFGFADGGAVPAMSYLAAGGPPATAYTGGGTVRGAGHRTEDAVPAMLSAGEHVWSASDVDAAGGQGRMYQLRAAARRGLLSPGALGFADGGAVRPTPHASLPSQLWAGARPSGDTITPRDLRRAMSGMALELTVDGRTTLDGRLRDIADARVLAHHSLTRR